MDYWISHSDINKLENIYIDNDDEKSEVVVYFKKVYQQLSTRVILVLLWFFVGKNPTHLFFRFAVKV